MFAGPLFERTSGGYRAGYLTAWEAGLLTALGGLPQAEFGDERGSAAQSVLYSLTLAMVVSDH